MKAKRKVYHITKNRDGNWQSKITGRKTAVVIGTTKQKVIDKTVRLAKKHPLSQIIIHKEDGKIQSERTYGEDPRRSKG